MKNFKRECKSTLSMVLIFMLVFTMLISCSGLSAGADEAVQLPKVVNEPTITFRTARHDTFYARSEFELTASYVGYTDNSWSGHYGSNLPYYIGMNTVNLLFDDTEASQSINDIDSVQYTFTDEDRSINFTNNAQFTVVDSFDTVLVKVGFRNIFRGIYNSDTINYSRYCTVIDSFRNSAQMSVTITYDDGSVDTVPVNIIEDRSYINNGDRDWVMNSHPSTEHTLGYYFDTAIYDTSETTSMVLLRLAHCKDINSNDLLKMENAIFNYESETTTNKYYVDMQSKDDVVLPFTGLSNAAELVQTRVGEDLVYNAPTSVDFKDDAVSAVSDGQPSDYGKVYYLDDTKMTEDNLYYLARKMYNNGSSYRILEFDDDETAENAVNPNNFYDVYHMYHGIFNSSRLEPQKYANSDGNAVALKALQSGYIIDNIPQRYLNGSTGGTYSSKDRSFPYYIELNKDAITSDVFDALYNLRNGSFISSVGEQTIKNEPVVVTCPESSCSYNHKFNPNMNIRVDFKYRNTTSNYLLHSTYSFNFSEYEEYCDFLTDPKNYLKKHSGQYYRYLSSVDEITGVYIYFNSLNNEAFEKICDVLNQYNVGIDESKSYYPDFDSATKISVKDYYGITEAEGIQEDYTGSYEFNFSDYAKYGSFVTNYVERNTDEVITDTYDGEKIRFPVDMLKTCEKGETYNVVNQLQIVNDNAEYSYMDLGALSSDGSWANTGNIYYLNGELIRNSITATYGRSEYYSKAAGRTVDGDEGLIRHTEYKWGELVLASRPDSVKNLKFDISGENNDIYTLSWTKPLDEGFGVTTDADGKKTTRADSYIYLKNYNVSITDESGKEIYNQTVNKDENLSDNVSIPLSNTLITKEMRYKATVTAENVLGTSDVSTIYITIPSVEITMTPDQPQCRESDTVTYTETVKNTGSAKLTDVTVNQSVSGEYDTKSDMKVTGTSVVIPDMEPGTSYTFTYRVPASSAVNNKIENTAVVTTSQKVSDSADSTVYIIHPNLYLTKTTDKNTYYAGETVTYTDVIVNTGDTPLKNVVVTEDNDKGKFKYETEDASDKNIEFTADNIAVIAEILPGESVTLKYIIAANDVKQDENGNAKSITTGAVPAYSDIIAEAYAECKILHPAISVKTSSDELYSDTQNIVYTDTVTNTGDCTLHNVVISENFKEGSYSENPIGTVNENGAFVIDELKPGESVELTYTIPASDVTLIDCYAENNVTAVCDENVTDTDSTKVKVVHYEISVVKIVDSETHEIGDRTVFTSIITNKGNYPMENISVKENLEGEWVLSNGAAVVDGSLIISKLNPNESYTYSYVVEYSSDLIDEGNLTSVVTVDFNDSLLICTAENETLYSKPMLTVSKSADKKQYTVGNVVTYTDSITNIGDTPLTNVTVTESLKGNFESDYESTENTVTVPVIKAGETVKLTFKTVIESEDITGDAYICSVEVNSAEGTSDSDTLAVKIVSPAVSVSKTTDKNVYDADGTIIYLDIITNEGNITLTNVVITEDLDGKFTNCPENCTVNGKTLTVEELKAGESIAVKYLVNISDAESVDGIISSTVSVVTDNNVSAEASVNVSVKKNAETDSGTEIDTDTSVDTETDKESDAADTSTDIDSETDIDTDTDTSTDIDTETDLNSDTDIHHDTETDADSDTDTSSDIVTDTDTDSESDTDSDSESDTDSDPEVQTYMLGDVNCDGVVSVADAVIAQKESIKIVNLAGIYFAAGDINDNLKITIFDSVEILRYSVKIPSDYGIGTIREYR